MKGKAKWIWLAGGIVLLVTAIAATLFFTGVCRPNTPSRAKYPVWGVDVSEYQGKIDWSTLEEQGVQFAFIRATEGSGYTDAFFAENWHAITATGIVPGAYHFFSFDSPAATQAANFIAAVPTGSPTLPPVVDIELYGAHKAQPPEAEAVRRQLDEMLLLLEQHYGAKPIVYATQTSYNLYLAGYYADYPIWIREVFFTPSLEPGRSWQFWQYSDRGRLAGYDGEEKYIDLNVFSGDINALRQMVYEPIKATGANE